MKTKFLPIVLLFAYANCNTNKHIYMPERLVGRYSPDDGDYTELILSSNFTFLYYHLPSGHSGPKLNTSDTIAYGNWSSEANGWLAVSSPPYLLKKLKLTVEENSNNNADTVYIKINNPFEKDIIQPTFYPTNAIYAATVLVMNAWLEQINLGSTSNVIKLYNPKKLPVQSIRLVIYTAPRNFDDLILGNYTEWLKACKTETYGVKSPASNRSNQFVINIPDLTEGFLEHRRLNRDFIKVIDENHLEWDGHIFKRERNSAVR